VVEAGFIDILHPFGQRDPLCLLVKKGAAHFLLPDLSKCRRMAYRGGAFRCDGDI